MDRENKRNDLSTKENAVDPKIPAKDIGVPARLSTWMGQGGSGKLKIRINGERKCEKKTREKGEIIVKGTCQSRAVTLDGLRHWYLNYTHFCNLVPK